MFFENKLLILNIFIVASDSISRPRQTSSVWNPDGVGTPSLWAAQSGVQVSKAPHCFESAFVRDEVSASESRTRDRPLRTRKADGSRDKKPNKTGDYMMPDLGMTLARSRNGLASP
jgi:hypothetical protein